MTRKSADKRHNNQPKKGKQPDAAANPVSTPKKTVKKSSDPKYAGGSYSASPAASALPKPTFSSTPSNISPQPSPAPLNQRESNSSAFVNRSALHSQAILESLQRPSRPSPSQQMTNTQYNRDTPTHAHIPSPQYQTTSYPQQTTHTQYASSVPLQMHNAQYVQSPIYWQSPEYAQHSHYSRSPQYEHQPQYSQSPQYHQGLEYQHSPQYVDNTPLQSSYMNTPPHQVEAPGRHLQTSPVPKPAVHAASSSANLQSKIKQFIHT
ncbi:hypothetical protein CANCADRAFT_173 [Tortispora caseinolytica NRRL Y-17796]|uniref:Uncharacterized protein n=1 Tax=Tortispora caseinolytica NRRL Y-17796 TaxID=767744 RepID=A0A1E4TIR3_9ASCO|nr:hypothetical protein CANCADRAFT_173 [Tortispora caseinolytica NRRL Y-17796]